MNQILPELASIILAKGLNVIWTKVIPALAVAVGVALAIMRALRW